MARRDDTWLWLAIGGLMVLSTRPNWNDGEWVFPLPDLRTADGATYRGVVSDGWGTPRPGGRVHTGADVMYRRRSPADRPEYRAGSSDGSAHHFAPEYTPVLAARAGVVHTVAKTPRGWSVVVDHGAPWATYYQHLANVFRVKGARLAAGDVIGTAGYDPLDPAKLRHLHFEAWHSGGAGHAVDVAPRMDSWRRVAPWTPNRKA